jgi:hypothetical protein
LDPLLPTPALVLTLLLRPVVLVVLDAEISMLVLLTIVRSHLPWRHPQQGSHQPQAQVPPSNPPLPW